jgi:hypothetical protein
MTQPPVDGETVAAAIKRAQIMSGMLKMAEPVGFGSDAAVIDELAALVTKLWNYRMLHGGDVMSLSGDLDREHERVVELEAEVARLRAKGQPNGLWF